jgi:hypothetical protein
MKDLQLGWRFDSGLPVPELSAGKLAKWAILPII